MNHREASFGNKKCVNVLAEDAQTKKKRILVVPAWYPTIDNPVAGSFFKEQCLLLSESYDITVLTISYREDMWLKHLLNQFLRKNEVVLQNGDGKTDNYCEFNATIRLRRCPKLFSPFIKLYRSVFEKKEHREGIGEYIKKSVVSANQKALEKIISRYFTQSFDLIYGITAQNRAMQVQMLAEICHVPYILGEHSPFPQPGQVVNDRDHDALENANCFFAISKDKIRQVMMQDIRLKRIEYIGNMVDESKFLLVSQHHEIKTFLIVASYTHMKNYDMFIATMNQLKKMAKCPFKVIIAGYGANKWQDLQIASFENRIRETDFSDCVTMIPEATREEMPEIYRQADAFVLTSIQEGQPVSALEAACCGLPIFSTRCGGVEDYVHDHIGRIVDITDYRTLAIYLNDFLEGRISFDNSKIRDEIVSRYGREAYMAQINRIIEEVIGC